MWQRDVAICFEDPDARQDDVPGQIGKEQHVAVDETGVGKKELKSGHGRTVTDHPALSK